MYSATSCTASRRPTEESARSGDVCVSQFYMNDVNTTDNIEQRTQDTTHGEINGGRIHTDREENNRVGQLHIGNNMDEETKEHQHHVTVGSNDVGGDAVDQYFRDFIRPNATLADITSPKDLMKGYRNTLSACIGTQPRVKGRRWIGSAQVQALAIVLPDKIKKYWLGLTTGNTVQARALHRQQKQVIGNIVFRCLLVHTVTTIRVRNGEAQERVNKASKVGGFKAAQGDSLFAQYVARLEQLPTEATAGCTAYTPIRREDSEQPLTPAWFFIKGDQSIL
jgi:hypothetical protein